MSGAVPKADAQPSSPIGTDEELIERLRKMELREVSRDGYCREQLAPINPDGPEAADALQSRIAEVERLREALRGIEGRVDYATGLYHDATRWSSEDAPDGAGTLLDYVFAEVRAALSQHRTTG